MIDDHMAFKVGAGQYSRSSFRLHPLRPDGTGLSEGCVTFYRREDFYTVRRALLATRKQQVLGGGDGEVVVIGRNSGACDIEES